MQSQRQQLHNTHHVQGFYGGDHQRGQSPSLMRIESAIDYLERNRQAITASRRYLLSNRQQEDDQFNRVRNELETESNELRRQWWQIQGEMRLKMHPGPTPIRLSPLQPAPQIQCEVPMAKGNIGFGVSENLHQPNFAHPQNRQSPQQPSHTPVSQPLSSQNPSPTNSAENSSNLSNLKPNDTKCDRSRSGINKYGLPAGTDVSGRPFWMRDSDRKLVHLVCPVSACGKQDFQTLHGFVCHLKSKHKNRKTPDRSKVLNTFGVVFDQTTVDSARVSPNYESSPSESTLEAAGRKQDMSTFVGGEEHYFEGESRLAESDIGTVVEAGSPSKQSLPAASLLSIGSITD
ncbi:hypothetical protein N7471_013446 [Penicillium samsonianum]|uniref:uncharacterized protein n=1 Tax=Penicillium samsonianum TaxID=1882272 RepID=UPI002548DAA4|nr:uncharacterized protein N7471_013446 [Penicillium samsonianum]KAJ6118826.1 hypothetical protein N7471_013446 [Penicillium samsonianum]